MTRPAPAAALALVLALGFAQASAQAGAGAPELSYTVHVLRRGDGLELEIELRFRGSASGDPFLVLPSRWAGEVEFYKAISGLRAVSAGASVQDTDNPHVKNLRHPPGQDVQLRYRVTPADQGGRIKPYRPLLNKDYFHFTGYGVWVRPAWDENKPRRVSLRWEGLPKGWALANSFGAVEAGGRASRPPLGEALAAGGAGKVEQAITASLRDLRHAVYVGGDFEVRKVGVGANPVYLAARGRWKFSLDAYAELVRLIVSGQRDFWQDHAFPYFLITLIPNGRACCDHGGTALTNAFASWFAADAGLKDAARYLYGHELFHTWNPGRRGLAAPEELLYWFSEGFTDYYTRLLSLRAGLMTLEDYVDDYNGVLHRYYTSPVRSAPNKAILKKFWTDYDVEKLPYQRGDILAHQWNALLRRSTSGRRSLDDVMRDAVKAGSGKSFSGEVLERLVFKHSGHDVSAERHRHAEQGEIIRPRPDALGPCVRLDWVEVGRFDPGFDGPVSIEKGVVTGVRPGGGAWRAGLRDGQKILEKDIRPDRPWKPARFHVQDGAGARWLNYLPMDAARVKAPRYRLDKELHAREPRRCMEWFGAPSAI